MHAHFGGKIFDIFRQDQLRGRAVRPPWFDSQPVGNDRIWNQGDIRQLVSQFGQRAWHVVGGSDDDQGMKAVLDGPPPCLHCIAECVERGIIEVDATGQDTVVVEDFTPDIAGRGAGIDSGDQKPLATTCRQQFERVVDARIAARQHDDTVGVAVERNFPAWQQPNEQAKTDGEQNRTQQNELQSD